MLWLTSFLLPSQLLLAACLYAGPALSQATTEDGVLVLTGAAATVAGGESLTGSASSSSHTGSGGSMSSSFSSMTASNTSSSSTTTKPSVIVLTGISGTKTSVTVPTNSHNETASSTSSTPVPTNTTPCNLHPEFCNRRYSNITQVCAHNSPFVKPNNVAANQDFDVTTQLNDGIRMLQIQAHVINGTAFLCHTSCDLLNAGTMTAYLTTVTAWVRDHPYDVITILIGNALYNDVGNYTAPIEDSGLLPFVFKPAKNPATLDDWPTLSNMIITSSRVVIFMDYEVNTDIVPYILNEFTFIWETPFDPIDRAFPCTVQRPPDLSTDDAKSRMYMLNHNLNTELSILGTTLLVPTVPLLNVTNNVTGYGSLGLTATQCDAMWGKPPNILNVDYYNVGNGSVFEVAAKWNNVTYNSTCCGFPPVSGVGRQGVGMWFVAGMALAVSVLLA